jgi:hypothetical protein
VGDNGRKRYTQEEFIEYLLEIYDDMKLNGEK